MRYWVLILVVCRLFAADPMDALEADINLSMNSVTPMGDVSPGSPAQPGGVIFASGPFRGGARIYVGASQFVRPTGNETLEVGPEWWKNARVRFVPLKDGKPHEAAVIDVPLSDAVILNQKRTSRNNVSLGLGESASVEFSFPMPPVGDYLVTLIYTDAGINRIGRISTFPRIEAIRAGDENPATRATWLFERKPSMRNYAEFEAYSREMIALRPDDWSLWEGLGIASLKKMDPELTGKYFAEAEKVFRRGTLVNGPPVSEWQQEVLEFLTLFEKLRPQLERARREGLWVRVDTHRGARTFRWYDTTVEPMKPLNVVDPRNPSGPVREERQEK